MNRKRWLLIALLVGCGAGVATMSFTVPSRTLYSSTNGLAEITLDGVEIPPATFEHGPYDPEMGRYPYATPPVNVEDIPSGTYTGTVAVQVLVNDTGALPEREVIGSCRVTVDAENQTHTVEWFDGSLPPGGLTP